MPSDDRAALKRLLEAAQQAFDSLALSWESRGDEEKAASWKTESVVAEKYIRKLEEENEWRRCEYCRCRTNAKIRACCEAGRRDDESFAYSRGRLRTTVMVTLWCGGSSGCRQVADGGKPADVLRCIRAAGWRIVSSRSKGEPDRWVCARCAAERDNQALHTEGQGKEPPVRERRPPEPRGRS